MNDGEEYRNPNIVGSEEEEDTMNGCLDLTGFQLHDLSEVDIPEALVELDLTTNRLSIIDPRIGLLTCLKKLSFRQNLLKDDGVSPISNWAAISGLEVKPPPLLIEYYCARCVFYMIRWNFNQNFIFQSVILVFFF